MQSSETLLTAYIRHTWKIWFLKGYKVLCNGIMLLIKQTSATQLIYVCPTCPFFKVQYLTPDFFWFIFQPLSCNSSCWYDWCSNYLLDGFYVGECSCVDESNCDGTRLDPTNIRKCTAHNRWRATKATKVSRTWFKEAKKKKYCKEKSEQCFLG